MIAIVDYGVGNLFSLGRSLEYLGLPYRLSKNVAELEQADQLILPGVGAFGDAAHKLHELALFEPLQEIAAGGKPLLGICLGMQLLFSESAEFGRHTGLDLIPGKIISLKQSLAEKSPELKTPHMGWDTLEQTQASSSAVAAAFEEGDAVYYVHSFYASGCAANTLAASRYGVMIPGIVQKDKIYGMQFHPEKSGNTGLALLKAFSEVK
ncbi:MAG: imidazole glycerol phosphate synthase subunit HisH [Enterococcaceae bacterium]|nr:imidazole glycerol phosphate synthase subunit HisH [Enterococcaceae bacterium]MCI1918844.1 imidazole glycerol phosphate synthase subunit HisH [Enterococcaceae bacterium]